MSYKIIDIEGIGDVYAEKMTAAGINTVEQLLEKCAGPAAGALLLHFASFSASSAGGSGPRGLYARRDGRNDGSGLLV